MCTTGGKYDMASELLRKVLQQNKSCTKVIFTLRIPLSIRSLHVREYLDFIDTIFSLIISDLFDIH